LSLSEDEIKEVGYITIPNGTGGASIGWDTSKDPMKEIVFGETVATMIRTKLSRLNDVSQLNNDQFDLYEKFIEIPA
jgi:hypothetical protein